MKKLFKCWKKKFGIDPIDKHTVSSRYDPDSEAGDGYYDLPKDHKLEYLNLSLDSSLDDMARYHDFDLKWGLLGK